MQWDKEVHSKGTQHQALRHAPSDWRTGIWMAGCYLLGLVGIAGIVGIAGTYMSSSQTSHCITNSDHQVALHLVWIPPVNKFHLARNDLRLGTEGGRENIKREKYVPTHLQEMSFSSHLHDSGCSVDTIELRLALTLKRFR